MCSVGFGPLRRSTQRQQGAIPKNQAKESLPHLRPLGLGLVPTLQGVSAKTIPEAALGAPFPQHIDDYAYRRGSDASFALMPLRLITDCWRGQGLALLHALT